VGRHGRQFVDLERLAVHLGCKRRQTLEYKHDFRVAAASERAVAEECGATDDDSIVGNEQLEMHVQLLVDKGVDFFRCAAVLPRYIADVCTA
jgi:hypothetical protein